MVSAGPGGLDQIKNLEGGLEAVQVTWPSGPRFEAPTAMLPIRSSERRCSPDKAKPFGSGRANDEVWVMENFLREVRGAH